MVVAAASLVVGVVVACLLARHTPVPAGAPAADALKVAASMLVALVLVGVLAAVPMALVLVVASALAGGLTGWIDANPALAALVAVAVVGVLTDRVLAAAVARRG
jgi:hypothetical protein